MRQNATKLPTRPVVRFLGLRRYKYLPSDIKARQNEIMEVENVKRAPYMSKAELQSFMFVGCMAGQLKEIAKVTTEKDWLQKIKTAATYLCRITDERAACLDLEQLLSVNRRRKNTRVVMLTEDAERYKEPQKELVTVDLDDLETLAELALDNCNTCCTGDNAAECGKRKAFHRLGIAPAVDDPQPGCCEFIAR